MDRQPDEPVPAGGPKVRIECRELGRLLKALRVRQGDSQVQVEKRLESALKQRYGPPAVLEEGGGGFLELSDQELQGIADAWGVPRLMLDPLVSERVDEVCVVERLGGRTARGLTTGSRRAS
jgi:hypothetical protein